MKCSLCNISFTIEYIPQSNPSIPPAGAPAPPSSPGSAPPALPDLVSPVVVAILAVANFLLPLWLSGFLTGLAVAGVATYWVDLNLDI